MRFLTLLFLVITIKAFPQTGSEIYLFDVSKTKIGKLSLSNPQNVSQHVGYDNQPFFDGKANKIYYSSFNAEGRSDIKVYDVRKKVTTSFTSTNEREYSPTITPDRKFISCIIQRDNGAQDLGKYPIKGGPPIVLIDNLIVGYHAWVDADRVIIFVLGEPNSLQIYNVKTKEAKNITQKVGRSLHKIPGENAMSFVQKNSENDWQIMRWDIATGVTSSLCSTLTGREDYTWTPDRKIIMSDGTSLFLLDPKAEKTWTELEFQSGKDVLMGVTRLSLNQKGTQLALVVAE
jgi:Periplasmic component of the Tol biopolymer transport system